MLNPEDYLSDKDDGLLMRETGPWVCDKYYYIRRYIYIFETSMRIKWPNRTYIDLFSGPGKCKNRETGKVYIGSPLIAITTDYPFTKYYFIDNNQEYISALKQRCIHSVIMEKVSITQGDANIEVKKIVEEISKVKGLNLALLDPEGFELKFSTVRTLASIEKMDLIIYYPQMGINREFIKDFNNEGNTKIDEYFGGREWREIYKLHKTKEKLFLHRELIDLYKSKLRGIGYKVKGIDEIEREPLIVNSLDAPLYRLVFASKHDLGQEFWNKITEKDPRGQMRLF